MKLVFRLIVHKIFQEILFKNHITREFFTGTQWKCLKKEIIFELLLMILTKILDLISLLRTLLFTIIDLLTQILFQVEFVINWENWKLPIKQSRWPNFIFFNQMSQIHIIFNCWTPATYPSKVIPCSKRQYGHTDTLSLKSKKAMLIYISCLVLLPIT